MVDKMALFQIYLTSRRLLDAISQKSDVSDLLKNLSDEIEVVTKQLKEIEE